MMGERLSRDDAADLCGRLAALSRAGLPVARAWSALAEGSGPVAGTAGDVCAMLAVGGSVGDGIRFAASRTSGPGTAALCWLAVTAEVIERTGAPAALVLDDVATGLLDEIAAADERDVALAGPRATSAVLSSLPLVGLGLGAALGVDAVRVLLTTPPGWACAAGGCLLWLTGRAWSARLVSAATGAGGTP